VAPRVTKDLVESAPDRLEAALGGTNPSRNMRRGAGHAEPAFPDEPAAASTPEPPSKSSDDDEAVPAGPAAEPAEASDDAAPSASGADSSSELDSGAEGERKAAEGEKSIVRLHARGGFVHHTLCFSDDIYDRLRIERTNMWVYQVDAAFYPFERPIGDRLGLIASYESIFSGSVKDTDFGSTFPVTYREIYGGVRARYPVGGQDLGFDLTFGQMQSGLGDKSDAAHIPNLSYTLLRASLDVGFNAGPLRATASAAFRLPLGFGQISEQKWFPRMGGYGFEATVGLEYPISRVVGISAGASLRRYLLEMNSVPEDAVNGTSEVAGGAVDLYTAGYLGMGFKL